LKSTWAGPVVDTPQRLEDRRAFILEEIRRLAKLDGGRAPGRLTFERVTGIKEAGWRGVFWARWNDAVADAGCSPNQRTQRLDSDDVLSEVVRAARHFGHVPTFSEMRLYRRHHPSFPNDKTVASHFASKAALIHAIRQRAESDASLVDVLAMLPAEVGD
jgi:hypothetical protein